MAENGSQLDKLIVGTIRLRDINIENGFMRGNSERM